MGLLSFFRRTKGAGARKTQDAGDDAAAARTRARRRLMGATVLLALGVIGFPMVFETQPRPIPVDIPIEIPRKDAAPGLAMPPARPVAPRASAAAATPREDIITESPAEAGKELPAPVASAPVARAAASAADASKKSLAQPRPAASTAAPAVDSVRAKALLEGKETAKDQAAASQADESHGPGRYVVQVGAFADAAAARETRSKVEKLGLKSYTQVVETTSGSRIRVRAGPFASRDEADKALAKAKAAGMTAVVLTL